MGIHLGVQAAFLACGLTALGLIFLVIGIISAGPGQRSLKWPSVDGAILSSMVAFDPMLGRNHAQVCYQYAVDGKAYTGSRIAFNQGGLFAGARNVPAGDELPQYREGQAVVVYYDPADPGRSVLIPGSGTQSMIPIGVGGLFFILGLIAGLFALV